MGFDRIAVIAERYVALGFKLVGISDVFIEGGDSAVSLLSDIMNKKEFNLVMVEDKIQKSMSSAMLRSVKISIDPLVVFIPSPSSKVPIESVESLAKRVLGVDIKGVG